MNSERKSKRQERRERVRQQQMRGRLITVGLIVAAVVFVVFLVISSQRPPAEVVVIDPGTHPNPNDNSMGATDAPIVIEEFSDFQCPYCKQFHETTEPLLREYYIDTGKVRFVYRSMGNWVSQNIGGVNTESRDAALAMYCGGDQNKFWEMHAYLFANNMDGENIGAFSDKRLERIAEAAGLDMEAFKDCYDSGKFEDRVQEDYNEGTSAGIKGTPAFRISYTVNGEEKTRMIEGAQPFSKFQQELEAALNEIGTVE